MIDQKLISKLLEFVIMCFANWNTVQSGKELNVQYGGGRFSFPGPPPLRWQIYSKIQRNVLEVAQCIQTGGLIICTATHNRTEPKRGNISHGSTSCDT